MLSILQHQISHLMWAQHAHSKEIQQALTLRLSLINRAALTPVTTLKLMSTFTSVSLSVSLIIGTCTEKDSDY